MEFRYLDLKGNGPEKNRGYRYVLVIIDNFLKIGFTIPLKNKNAQTIKDSFEKTLISSKRKPNLIELDRVREFYNNIFQDLQKNYMKIYSRKSSFGAVFAKRFTHTIRDLLKRPVFEKSDSNWIDILPTITKQCSTRIPSSTKLTPSPASLKKNEGYVHRNLLDKRKKIKPKYEVGNLFTTAELKQTFSKGDTTNWSYKLIKLQKLLMIQYQVIVLIINQKDIMNRY